MSVTFSEHLNQKRDIWIHLVFNFALVRVDIHHHVMRCVQLIFDSIVIVFLC